MSRLHRARKQLRGLVQDNATPQTTSLHLVKR